MRSAEFHVLGQRLAKSTSEAELRTAVSRAYYAALNRAAEYVEGQGTPLPDDHRYHEMVASGLRNGFPSLADQLIDLRTRRGDADYSVWLPWGDDVGDALEVADWIIKTIDEKGA